MSLRWLGVSFAFTFALAAQPAAANQDVACPEGQAIRAIGDKTAVCVPIPPPVDLAPLNAAINAETAARAAGDAALQGAINAEAVARMAADQDLRLLTNEIKGDYAFTGTTVCLSSSKGFNPDLTPFVEAPQPPPATVLATIVNLSSHSVNGIRTFNGDGRGTTASNFYVINGPSTFHFFGAPSGVSGFAGVGSASTVTGTFTYEVTADGLLSIQDDAGDGIVTKGGSRVGWKVLTRNLPRYVGHLGKDVRRFSITHDDVAVETSVNIAPDGTEFPTPRVCHRERTLYKIAD
jgi:hypothetical protein